MNLNLNELRDSEFNDNDLIETSIIIMKEFGYTLEEFKKIPIPTYFFMIDYLNKISKKR